MRCSDRGIVAAAPDGLAYCSAVRLRNAQYSATEVSGQRVSGQYLVVPCFPCQFPCRCVCYSVRMHQLQSRKRLASPCPPHRAAGSAAMGCAGTGPARLQRHPVGAGKACAGRRQARHGKRGRLGAGWIGAQDTPPPGGARRTRPGEAFPRDT